MKYGPEELPARCRHLIKECVRVAAHYRFQAELWEGYAYDDEESNALIKHKRHRQYANEKAARKAKALLDKAI